jgi:hypothetical protein
MVQELVIGCHMTSMLEVAGQQASGQQDLPLCHRL